MLVVAYQSQLGKLGVDQLRQTAEVYSEMLADLDFDTARAAVEQLLSTNEFMPTIAAIRKACLAIAEGPKRPGGDAWGDVLDAISRHGRYRFPSFEDPVTARCVQQLGWTEICDSENQPSDRARFIELYDQLAAHERVEKLSAHLPARQRFEALREGAAPLSEIIKNLPRGDS